MAFRQAMLRALAGLLLLGGGAARTFSIDNDRFMLDGEPVQLISGSVHYHRIVKDQWRDRLERVKAMGLNAIELYVPWNYHERFPGQYTFDGMADVVQFIQEIQDLDMLVLLRVGPYICAEWDFGGLPWWLASSAVEGGGKMKLRSSDPAYMHHVERWFNALLPRLAPLLISRGGPVVMVQLENEYGFLGDEGDKKYMRELLRIAKASLGDDIIYYSTDPPPNVRKGSLPGDEMFTVVDFGPGWYNLDDAFGAQKAYNPSGKSAPLCAEFYPGWLVHWGEKMANTSAQVLVDAFADILRYGNNSGSVNFYMAHGGTNFGWTAGAGIAGGKGDFAAHITSYDYDTMVSEAGDYGQPGIGGPNKFEMIRKAVETHQGRQLPPAPPRPEVVSYGEVRLDSALSLHEALEGLWPGDGIISQRPLPMEEYGQGGGLILYETMVPAESLRDGATLDLGEPAHDYAKVLLDGRDAGTLDRNKAKALPLPAVRSDADAVRLSIMVQALGRDNAGAVFDMKGLQSQEVKLDGKLLEAWRVFPLPLDQHKDWPALQRSFANHSARAGNDMPAVPAFFRGTFKADPGLRRSDRGALPDTFIQMPGWHKGVAFINGFNLGWYWPAVGPQMTMYVPGPLLEPGENELILFELDAAPTHATVTLGDTPDFFGPAGERVQSSSMPRAHRSTGLLHSTS